MYECTVHYGKDKQMLILFMKYINSNRITPSNVKKKKKRKRRENPEHQNSNAIISIQTGTVTCTFILHSSYVCLYKGKPHAIFTH